MTVRVGINGFGRIGRNFFRAAKDQGADIDFVAVNDLGSVETMAHLLKNDSVHGQLPLKIRATRSGINVEGDTLLVLSEREPENLPWGDLGVDVVIESTGIFTKKEAANKHRKAGAPKVIISAPSGDCDATFVVGVNDDKYNPNTQHVISNASCTTNCFVPMIKVLDDAFGVQQGLMTTIHGYTGDQALVDGPHSDLRRARAAAINIVPTSTGAARATGLVMRKMQGRLDGIAMRVPIPDGSLTDFVGVLRRKATVEQINAAFKAAATRGPLAKVLDYSEEPLVSSDIVGSAASCTFDAGLTMSQGTLVKICGWYDNEMGYSNRLVDLAVIVGKKKATTKRRTKKRAAPKRGAAKKKAPAKKRGARRRVAASAPASAQTATKRVAAKKKAPAKKRTAAKSSSTKTTASARKKAPVAKTTAKKKAPAKKKSTARRKTTAKKKAPAKKKSTARRKTTAKKKAPAKKKSTARRKTTAKKKAPAKKKTTAKRSASRR